jgi:hypothetical protein
MLIAESILFGLLNHLTTGKYFDQVGSSRIDGFSSPNNLLFIRLLFVLFVVQKNNNWQVFVKDRNLKQITAVIVPIYFH